MPAYAEREQDGKAARGSMEIYFSLPLSLHPVSSATVSQPADLRLQTRHLNIHRADLHSPQMAKTDARYGKCQFSKICFRDKTNKAIQREGGSGSKPPGRAAGGCARVRVCACERDGGCKGNFEAVGVFGSTDYQE